MVLPSAFRRVSRPEDRARIRGLWEAAVREAHAAYGKLVAELEWQFCPPDTAVLKDTHLRKLLRGAARSVLPNATETKIVCTCNARALRHFIEERASPGADAEIRRVALAMYDAALPVWPDILGDYRVARDGDGVPYLTTEHRKV